MLVKIVAKDSHALLNDYLELHDAYITTDCFSIIVPFASSVTLDKIAYEQSWQKHFHDLIQFKDWIETSCFERE